MSFASAAPHHVPPVLIGADYSVYTRIVRLALAEKGIACRFETVDVFAPDGPPAGHRARHPFGRIPAFEHGAFSLYEAAAIARYVDEAFPGPALQPATSRGRARMTQVISVLDSYGFRPLVLDIYVERVSAPARGRTPDEALIAAALPAAATCLGALEGLADGEGFGATQPTLADLHAAAMFAYFRLAPEGEAMLARHSRLAALWAGLAERPSVVATRYPAEAG
jgi:glutathione S-transferase